jgi:hypothetical protein
MKIEIHGNAEDDPVYSVHRAKLLNDPIYFAEQMGYPLYPWQKDMLRLAMKPGRKRILLGHHADHIIIDDMVGDDMEAETSKKRVDAYVNLTKANTNLNEARKIADRARDAYESLKEVVLSDEEVRLRAIEDGINECKSRIAANDRGVNARMDALVKNYLELEKDVKNVVNRLNNLAGWNKTEVKGLCKDVEALYQSNNEIVPALNGLMEYLKHEGCLDSLLDGTALKAKPES